MRRLIVLLPLAIAATSPPDPAAFDRGNGQTEDVRLKRDAHDRMTVSIKVGGSGPYDFLVDTGSERTVISRALADRLGLVTGERTMMRSVLGSMVVSTVNIPSIVVSRRDLTVSNAPALDAAHIGADGMLGVDTLIAQRVMFDFKRKTMSISPSRAPQERVDADTIVVEARRVHGRLLFTNAMVNGRSVVVVIDTGSQITIGNAALRSRMLGRRTPRETVEIETIAGEKAFAHLGQVRSLEIGGIMLKDMKIAFTDAPVFRQLDLENRPALLLGMNAMRAFDRVSIDFATRQVRFVMPGTSMARGVRMASR